MRKITLHPLLRAQLNGLKEEYELSDEKGHVLGHFVPADLYRKLLYAAVEKACPLSSDEIEKRKQATGGRPLAEIWKSLGAR